MIRSMTGFGRGEYADDRCSVQVEIRSVNHKFSDITVHMAKKYLFAEDEIRKEIKKTVSRGKMNVSVNVDLLTEDDQPVEVNMAAARAYLQGLERLKEELGFSGGISLEYLASLPDVMKMSPELTDGDEVLGAILKAVSSACAAMDEMRLKEGRKLADDLIARGRMIAGMTEEIEEKAPQVEERYRLSFTERINEILADAAELPEERIAVEAAVFADKSNITEELVRLKSHCAQLEDILNSSEGPCGKRLDFLVQEMNREANTICSKANFLEITALALDIKSEIEKIREQVQNIE